MTANATKPTDVDIMMYLDGELEGDAASTVESYLADSEDASEIAASLGQISALVQGSIDLDADAAEEKLAGLWGGIDTALQSAASDSAASDSAIAQETPVISIQAKADAKATEKLVEQASWFGGWQSHIAIGALAAAAAILLMYGQKAEQAAPRAVATHTPPTAGNSMQPRIVPVVLRSQEPEVEALEVYDGSGVIMTVPADAESDDAATAVIWITSDDVAADPI